MLTLSQLAPQIAALVVVIAIPVVFAYSGLKGGLRLWVAYRGGRTPEFWRQKRRWFLPVIVVDLAFVLLFAYGWIWEANWVDRVDVRIEAEITSPLRFVHLSDLHLEG